jgi:predicted NBD/HSP70 family sugar kinase
LKVVYPADANGNSLYRVFNCIRRYGPLTKKELQKHTGLSWGSISTHTACLLAKKVIVEHTGQSDANKGPNPRLYTINHQKNRIIGIDIQMHRICGAVITLDGKKICSRALNLKSRGAGNAFKKILTVLEALFKVVENPKEIKSIGFSMPGIINREERKPFSVHHFTGVFPADMETVVERKFGVPAFIFHDPDCMLAAHMNNMQPEEYAVMSKSNVLLIRWSYGIGVSILSNGEFYYGDHHAAGEMGHMVVNPLGPRCICGDKGCLEVYASIRCVLEKISRGIHSGELNSEMIWEAYRKKNTRVVSIVNETVDYMASAIINTIKILDPRMVIIEGEFASAPPECIRRLNTALAGRFYGLKTIIQARPWEDSAVIGAAEMLTKRVLLGIITKRQSAWRKKETRKALPSNQMFL